MDSLHAIGFYVSSALSLGGALLVAFLSDRSRRSIALLGVGVGVAAVYASLSAGFAAFVVLVSFAGCAVLIARPDARTYQWGAAGLWRQVGAAGTALVFAGLAYAAYRGAFAHVTFNGGAFGAAALGRLLFARDVLAAEAIAALIAVALIAATLAWRARERGRQG